MEGAGPLRKIAPAPYALSLRLLAAALMLTLLPLGAAKAAGGTEGCLECHEAYVGARHGNTGCLDCHPGSASVPHEGKQQPQPCRRCHEGTVASYAGSGHKKSGLACRDCHNVHFLQKDKGNRVCAGCHGSAYEAFSASLHAKKGSLRCTDCHDPHAIRPYRELGTKERINVCARCHGDYLNKHAWLPYPALHFGYLECATCHSRRSEKSIVFFFARKSPEGKVRLPYDQLVRLYGTDPAGLIREGSRDDQIGRLFRVLARRDKNLVIDASVVVTKPFHEYSENPVEERRCVACHSGRARFYGSMFFVLPGKGSAEYIPLKGTLLASYPIAASTDFFLLSKNKLKRKDIIDFLLLKPLRTDRDIGFKWIDFIGFWLIAITGAAICCHIVLRLTVRR